MFVPREICMNRYITYYFRSSQAVAGGIVLLILIYMKGEFLYCMLTSSVNFFWGQHHRTHSGWWSHVVPPKVHLHQDPNKISVLSTLNLPLVHSPSTKCVHHPAAAVATSSQPMNSMCPTNNPCTQSSKQCWLQANHVHHASAGPSRLFTQKHHPWCCLLGQNSNSFLAQ